jgi:tetratricopeptide (TPR) repeat protein
LSIKKENLDVPHFTGPAPTGAAPRASAPQQARFSTEKLVSMVKAHYAAAREVRRGLCLLNAGQYEEADAAFRAAMDLGCADRSLPAYLAGCLIGQGKLEEAAECVARSTGQANPRAVDRIRRALALRALGRQGEAVETLEEAIREDPDNAELHYQLGTMFSGSDRMDEAERHFAHALALDDRHTDAWVSLALCCAVRGAATAALKHLRRAQARRPNDARIGLLLSQAAKAVQHQGQSPRLQAVVSSDDSAFDDEGIEELSRVIEAEPDFVDAFLSIPVGDVDEGVFAMLLRTIERALERQPEHAELHFHCGQVLKRLGRKDAAIEASERAARLRPKFIRALIELGRLYQETDRTADAATRLEQAVAAGGEYADVFYLLGKSYHEQGQFGRARTAYHRALELNRGFEAAERALAALPE